MIAGGAGASVLEPILAGEPRGTRFAAAERSESAFKLWLRFGKPVRGRIAVDAGARRALVDDGASLLGVGVVACEGAFEPGDAVELVGPDGAVVREGNRLGPGRRARGAPAWARGGAPRPAGRLLMELRRVGGLPPYVFAAINDLKLELRRAGEDVVDLGFGNPDLPSPEVAVEKLREAVLNPRNHRYSSSRGIPNLRRAICDLYERRFGVDARPGDAGADDDRREGGARPPDVGARPAGRRGGRARARATRSTSSRRRSPARRSSQAAMGPDEDLFGNVVEAFERSRPRPRVLVLSFPHNPTTAVVDAGLHATGRRLRARAGAGRRPRLRLRRPRLRRPRASVDPPGRGRGRGRGRAVHADEVVLDGRLAGRLRARQRRRSSRRSPG